MTGPHPAVQEVRLAVRRALAERAPQPLVVACSGGADSLALLAAAVFECRHEPGQVAGVTVDHGLQETSTERADLVAAQMAQLGAAETMTIRVQVEAPGMGPEAAARMARYAALSQAAQRLGADQVLLGHTLDDQAETVLLGLTRGSGGRSIAGMRRGYVEDGVRFARPLLDVTRAQTEHACRAEGIEWWDDPHNDDPRFTRSRLRRRVLPVLEEELGPGVAQALARTADLLQSDLASLEEIADEAFAELRTEDGGIDTVALQMRTPAVVSRVLRLAARGAGCPPAELSKRHVDALVGVMDAVGAKQVQLPGHVTAYVDQDHVLRFRRT